jgi:putative ABC transport system ATP-binding protein
MSYEYRPTPELVVQLRDLSHTYGELSDGVVALRHVDLDLLAGERLAVMGRSGSGKTTLLSILAGLERPRAGSVLVAGYDVSQMRRTEREAYRRQIVGYVWQQSEAGLLPGLTVLQNVLVPMLGLGGSQMDRIELAMGLVDGLRLGDWVYETPRSLSPVETQRLALAIALANRPALLLADELTARLDWPAARELLSDLTGLLRQLGTAAILVTHDPRVARFVDRTIYIRDGVAVAAAAELPAARGSVF